MNSFKQLNILAYRRLYHRENTFLFGAAVDLLALSGTNMMFYQNSHFFKCIGHIIVLLAT
jgi:hypothetical protein